MSLKLGFVASDLLRLEVLFVRFGGGDSSMGDVCGGLDLGLCSSFVCLETLEGDCCSGFVCLEVLTLEGDCSGVLASFEAETLGED